MDQAINSAADISADSYRWMGRLQADFNRAQDTHAAAQGTDRTELGFADLLDFLNPLQHIPVVGSIYREITGDDSIKPGVKTAGDLLYGGPIGGLASIVNGIVKQDTGKDMMAHAADWVGMGENAPVQMAAANTVGEKAESATTPIAWNQPQPKPIGSELNAAPRSIASAASNEAVVTAAQSPFFEGLQKGAPRQNTMANTAQPKFFSPTASQFSGVKPAGVQAVSANVNDIANAASESASAPQSDFAQKMMAALDRYEAAKKTDAKPAPVVDTGL